LLAAWREGPGVVVISRRVLTNVDVVPTYRVVDVG
jgi:hypothetical protein